MTSFLGALAPGSTLWLQAAFQATHTPVPKHLPVNELGIPSVGNGAKSQNEVASNSYATGSGGGSSSPAPTHTSAGGRSYRRGRGKESRPMISPAPVYNSLTGDVYELPAETVNKAVDGFPVPAGFGREGRVKPRLCTRLACTSKRQTRRRRPADSPKGVPYLLNSIYINTNIK